MFTQTTQLLRCPKPAQRGLCKGKLALQSTQAKGDDVLFGELRCEKCQARYPILAGVALVLPEPEDYLLSHARGVARSVEPGHLPKKLQADFRSALEEQEAESAHIDDDLEADRVASLYAATHYLHTRGERWWGDGDPLIDELIQKHWDHGPAARLLEDLPAVAATLELGCGVGGLGARLHARDARSWQKPYLGLDASFSSVALGRHLLLGAPHTGAAKIPGDLLNGPLTVNAGMSPGRTPGVDLVVADLERPPVEAGAWDLTLSLNTIDMLEQPDRLPKLQRELGRPGGWAVQSSPYVWHPEVARKLRARMPKAKGSAAAVRALYEAQGLLVEKEHPHVPWLFFKHERQLEIYSVHLMRCRVP